MSPFESLLQYLKPVIFNIPQIAVDFIKERHYLHFLITGALAFVAFQYLDMRGVPTVICGVFGYIFGYILNYAREWYYATKGNAFSLNDILSGAYAGFIVWLLCGL